MCRTWKLWLLGHPTKKTHHLARSQQETVWSVLLLLSPVGWRIHYSYRTGWSRKGTIRHGYLPNKGKQEIKWSLSARYIFRGTCNHIKPFSSSPGFCGHVNNVVPINIGIFLLDTEANWPPSKVRIMIISVKLRIPFGSEWIPSPSLLTATSDCMHSASTGRTVIFPWGVFDCLCVLIIVCKHTYRFLHVFNCLCTYYTCKSIG